MITECFISTDDSMEPKINKGDTVIFQRQDVDNGEFAVILNAEKMVRKIRRNKLGITLLSLNGKYAPIFFTNEEIEELDVYIIGKVLEIRRQFDLETNRQLNRQLTDTF